MTLCRQARSRTPLVRASLTSYAHKSAVQAHQTNGSRDHRPPPVALLIRLCRDRHGLAAHRRTSRMLHMPTMDDRVRSSRHLEASVFSRHVDEQRHADALKPRPRSGRSDSINCGLCGRCFHLACLDPPLTSKPARGYAWACAPCSKRPPGQKVDLKKADGPVASVAAAQPSRKGKGRAGERSPLCSAGTAVDLSHSRRRSRHARDDERVALPIFRTPCRAERRPWSARSLRSWPGSR